MPEHISLNGSWTLRQVEKGSETLSAQVPGCVHLDLQSEGIIEDPFYRDNEQKVAWVGEADWSFSRTFSADASFLKEGRQVLRCDGLDTLATVRLNGEVLGETDNMFRCWEFDVEEHLKTGENEIEIIFHSPLALGEEKQKEYFLWLTGLGHHRLNGGNWFRKEQCNFGWDWGPMLPTCGIWKSIQLVGWTEGRLLETRIHQEHAEGSAELFLDTDYDLTHQEGRIRYTLSQGEKAVISTEGNATDRARLTVANPELWWPNGLGEQPLYALTIELIGGQDEVLDTKTLRIGLRDLQLVREKDTWGQSFTFSVNGHRFFAKGGNWIPAHSFDGAIDREKLEDLLESACQANMNMLRVWGGGKYESEDFYDLCDEKGLVVWQDFMFACSAYPAHDPAFMENVRVEAKEQVKRLQYRTCIGLWCGNNELEQIDPIVGEDREAGQMSWEDYKALFDDLIGGMIGELDPGRSYIPSSEFSPLGDREDTKNPNWGDAHLWAVWHGREPFEWYRTSFHRFCSEFGFQSFPHPKTVESYTLPEERNITSYVMELHQRSPIGNSAIMDYILSWFRLPVGWKNSVWLSQVVQAYAIKYAVEHWRRNMPRCMGAVYWQLNDCWPVASWASLDYFHRWKGLHYEAKKFFEPVHLSLVEDAEVNTVGIHLSNDGREGVDGQWILKVTDLEGKALGMKSGEGKVAAGSTKLLETVNLAEEVDSLEPRNCLIWGEWKTGEQVVSRNLTTLARPKHLQLRDPELKVEQANGLLKIQGKYPALFVILESEDPDMRYNDNYFHLEGGVSREIEILQGETGASVKAISLIDTYRE